MARVRTDIRIPTTNIRREQIFDKCKGICCHCGEGLRLGDNFSIEHVIPLNKGGTNDYKNIVALCKDCNFDKSDDVVAADYYEYAPKLIREQIEELMEEYYERDWLTENSLFKHDRFYIPIERTICAKGKVFSKNDQCEIKRITMDDFIEMTESCEEHGTEYIYESSEKEEEIVVELNGQCYKIDFKGKAAAGIYVQLTPGKGKGSSLASRGTFRMILVISRDIVWGPSSKNIIASCLDGIIKQFLDSLTVRKTKTALFINIDALANDRRGVEIVEAIAKCWNQSTMKVADADTGEVVFIRAIAVIGLGVDFEKDEEGRITIEEFTKKEKLYSGQLRKRMSKNSVDT